MVKKIDIKDLNLSHYIIKPCSDGVSMDVRPSKRFSLNLTSINFESHPQLKVEIKTSQVVILYFLGENPIKTTIYTSGRMLIDNRDESLVKNIIHVVISRFST
jgi:hypothetical protein